MSEKKFRVRFEQEDGKGEIVNEKGVELTAREVVDLLNEQQATINKLEQENTDWLGDKIRSLDEFEKCTNKLKKKILEQQSTIDKLEQRDYYNQSERYKILGRAIELTANYIDNSNEEHYDFCALVTEFEKELLDDE